MGSGGTGTPIYLVAGEAIFTEADLILSNYCIHLVDEKTEAQKKKITYPEWKQELNPGLLTSQFSFLSLH